MHSGSVKNNSRQSASAQNRLADIKRAKNTTTDAPSLSSVAAGGAGAAPSHEEIAKHAVTLWREKGCPHGCDEELWLEAERQLSRALRLNRDERDKTALADPRFSFNQNKDDLMEELNERFPEQTGKETTSL